MLSDPRSCCGSSARERRLHRALLRDLDADRRRVPARVPRRAHRGDAPELPARGPTYLRLRARACARPASVRMRRDASTATPTRRWCPGYRHLPGNHCGSTALRNLLAFHGGRDLRGDGASGSAPAPASTTSPSTEGSPSRFTNGRVATAGGAVRRADRRAAADATPSTTPRSVGRRAARSTPAARRCCSPTSTTSTTTASRPTSPATRSSSPATTTRSPTSPTPRFEELQTTRLENLAEARHAQHPVYPLAGHMFTVARGQSTATTRATPRPRAIARGAEQMLEPRARRVPGPAGAARASPPRSGAGPRRPRTGSGARASTTR